MAYPEGYAKAMRVMELAERFRFPVVSLIDTPGAYPGRRRRAARPGWRDRPLAGGDVPFDGADRRLRDRRGRLRRRGRAGGRRPRADAGERDLLGDLARRLRAILWRDDSQAKKAAAAFKPDALHCLELGVIDGIIAEPAGSPIPLRGQRL